MYIAKYIFIFKKDNLSWQTGCGLSQAILYWPWTVFSLGVRMLFARR